MSTQHDMSARRSPAEMRSLLFEIRRDDLGDREAKAPAGERRAA